MKRRMCGSLIVGLSVACTPAGAPPPASGVFTAPDKHSAETREPAAEQVHAEQHPVPSASPMAAAPKQEQQAYQQAQPVFAAYCSKCHTSGGGKDNRTALSHFNMDSYPFAGHHAAEITAAIRKVLGTAGSSPTMPKDMPGAVKGDDLGRILAWAEAYDRSHRSGASTSHEHHGYEHTGEDEHAGHHH